MDTVQKKWGNEQEQQDNAKVSLLQSSVCKTKVKLEHFRQQNTHFIHAEEGVTIPFSKQLFHFNFFFM